MVIASERGDVRERGDTNVDVTLNALAPMIDVKMNMSVAIFQFAPLC